MAQDRPSTKLTSDELADRLASDADELMVRLWFLARHGDAHRALRLVQRLVPVFNNGLIDLLRCERQAQARGGSDGAAST
jgi:hypothetical protein